MVKVTIPKINSAHGSDTRNILNRAIDLINAQGKSIQDLVAEGQLTPTQYAQLISIVNGNVSKGSITADDLDKNNFQLDQTHLSDELKQQITGNAPINAVPADESLTTEKYASGSVTLEKTRNSEQDISKQKWKVEAISHTTGLPTLSTKQLSSDFFRVEKGARFFRLDDTLNCMVHVYDEEYNHLGSYAGTIHSEVPIECYYARLSLFYRDNRDISDAYSELISKYKFYNYKFNNPVEMIRDESIYQLNRWQKGLVNTTNGVFLPSQNTISSDYILGKKGNYIETLGAGTRFYVVLFDQHFNYIKGYSYVTSSMTINDEFYAMRIVARYDDSRIISETEKAELINGLNLYNFTTLPNWVVPVTERGNHLSGKTLLNFGDSIASSQTEGVDGYHELIANKNKMNLVDHARNGATITVVEGNTNNLKTQIDNAIAAKVKPDYVLFDGLRNDVSHPENTIGEITTGYTESLDLNTFCGAFEYYCKTMRENWLGAKIIYIRTHNTFVVGQRQVVLGELALEMCRKWSIPYVDIYSEGGLNTHFVGTRGLYTLSETDGTHPNQLGYETFYVPPIESKMKSV